MNPFKPTEFVIRMHKSKPNILGEGPFESRDAAETFRNAEVGMPAEVIPISQVTIGELRQAFPLAFKPYQPDYQI